jgi:hypothetical protein
MDVDRSFPRQEVEAINKRIGDNRPTQVTTEVGKQVLRETRFSRSQINEAFAKALAKQTG